MLLEAAGISKIFGKLTALDGAALTVGENEFHGLIGPNGSGKSTLMKCIAGAEVPTQGKVSFVNTDITAFTPTERARAGMSLKFQITSVLPSLTLYDNILLALQAQSSLLDLVFSRTRGVLHDQVMTMLTQFRLADRAFDAAAALSHGQQQWLEIAMALAGKPKLLLLDERDISRQTTAQGRPVIGLHLCLPCERLPTHHAQGLAGASRYPAFPAPFRFEGRESGTKSGRRASRDRDVMAV